MQTFSGCCFTVSRKPRHNLHTYAPSAIHTYSLAHAARRRCFAHAGTHFTSRHLRRIPAAHSQPLDGVPPASSVRRHSIIVRFSIIVRQRELLAAGINLNPMLFSSSAPLRANLYIFSQYFRSEKTKMPSMQKQTLAAHFACPIEVCAQVQ